MTGENLKFKGFDITEEDRTFTNEFPDGGGQFSVRIPKPFERTAIHVATTRAVGGFSREQIGADEYEHARMVVTLNSVITEKPGWWEGAENCPSDEFLFSLWRWYLECEQEFDVRVKTKVRGKTLGKA